MFATRCRCVNTNRRGGTFKIMRMPLLFLLPMSCVFFLIFLFCEHRIHTSTSVNCEEMMKKIPKNFPASSLDSMRLPSKREFSFEHFRLDAEAFQSSDWANSSLDDGLWWKSVSNPNIVDCNYWNSSVEGVGCWVAGSCTAGHQGCMKGNHTIIPTFLPSLCFIRPALVVVPTVPFLPVSYLSSFLLHFFAQNK